MNATERVQARLIGEEVMRLRAEPVALREERDWFKGEMEQFMRAASANHARVALLEGLLRSVEWNCPDLGTGDCEGRCPWCQVRRADGHAPDCRLAASLGDADA